MVLLRYYEYCRTEKIERIHNKITLFYDSKYSCYNRKLLFKQGVGVTTQAQKTSYLQGLQEFCNPKWQHFGNNIRLRAIRLKRLIALFSILLVLCLNTSNHKFVYNNYTYQNYFGILMHHNSPYQNLILTFLLRANSFHRIRMLDFQIIL